MSSTMHPTLRPVTVCGRELNHAAHICAFFDSREQAYECVVPYFAEGLARNEQVVSIVDAATRPAHVADLASRGLPVAPCMERNQLKVLASEETYLEEEQFEVKRMFRLLETALRSARDDGFDRVRTLGDMSWALRGLPGTDDLMEYESRVNVLTEEHDCTLMCSYDVSRFNGRVVTSVLATHPLVVIGDKLYENPYYVPPLEYLRGLLRRGGDPLAAGPQAPGTQALA